MFGTAGAAAALFARNPSFIIKQARITRSCVIYLATSVTLLSTQLPALYVEALTRFPMPVKSVTTGVTCARKHYFPARPLQ